MDTFNKFLVGKQGERIVIQNLCHVNVLTLSEDDALNLAAWLVALSDKEKFDKLYEKIINT